MPIKETADRGFSTHEMTLFVTCAAIVATYIGFSLHARRQFKKSLEASDKMFQETNEKINEIVEIEKHKLTDN